MITQTRGRSRVYTRGVILTEVSMSLLSVEEVVQAGARLLLEGYVAKKNKALYLFSIFTSKLRIKSAVN